MMPIPVLHAGGFSWDEALVLAVFMAGVPAITWLLGRRKRDATVPKQPAPEQISDEG